MNLKRVFWVITTIIGMQVVASPTIQNVVAKQRFPWNGLVDITCEVAGIEGSTNGLYFALSAVMPESRNLRNVPSYWLMVDGVKSTDLEVRKNGSYHLVWDAKTDLGQVYYPNISVCVLLKKNQEKDNREMVQLWEGGPFWATMNIGAEKPEDYGYYFWWGDTVGYKRENDKWVASDGSNSDFSFITGNAPTHNKSILTLQDDGWIDSNNVLMPSRDAAHIHWGGEWRMPTKDEMDALNNCEWAWITQHGVNGYLVKGNGVYASNRIFLPATGCASSSYDPDLRGDYWSSVPDPNDNLRSWDISFNSTEHPMFSSYRYFGQSIRPVFETINVVGEFAYSPVFLLNTIEESLNLDNLSYNSSWIGGDSSATIVITDNGVEIYRGSGDGEFEWQPATVGKHTLTYTTYINEVAQEEVLAATVYNGFKYEVVNGEAVLTGVANTSGELVVPNTIDGYPVSIISFQPGLQQVKFDSEWDTTSTLSHASSYDSVSGVIAAYHKAQENNCAFPDPLTGKTFIWNKSHTTFAYFGQMYMEAGKTYVFGEHFDDCASVKVDGNVLFSVVSTSSKITSGRYTCNETGWHDVEFRLGDNTGGKGSWGVSWTTDFGLGYRDDGGASLTQSEWKKLLDPGDGSLFRWTDDRVTPFGELEGITAVTLPSSFLSLQTLSTLFPKSFKTIKTISMEGEISEIKPNTFAGCEALESIIIPDGVCSIGENAFAECKNLKSISIPQSVTAINGDAFVGCVSLKNVILPVKAFSLRPDLCKILQNGWIFSNGIYQSNDINDREATSMSLTINGPYEFSFDWKVSSEYSYDKFQWYFDDTLKNTISGTGSNWQKITYSIPEGTHTIRWTYSKDGSNSSGEDCGWMKLPEMKSDPFVMRTLFPNAYNEITNVVLIGDSDKIPDNVFAGCASLESISIPDGICEIGDHVFAGCTSLKSIVIPESVTNVVVESKSLMDVDGAVAAYEFKGTLDDGTGYAPSGNGSFVADRFGIANSAYYFNGQEQWFMNTQKTIEGTFSFAFWFKTDVEMSSTGSYTSTEHKGRGNYILFPKHGGVDRGYGAIVGTDGIKVMAHGDSYLEPIITYSNVIGSGWNHAVVTVSDNTNIKLYLNGVCVANGTGPSATAIFRVTAGGNYGFYTGYLDDLVVCDSALDDAAVKELYSWTAASFAGCNGIVDVIMPGGLIESMAEMFPDSYASITNVVLTGGVAQIPTAAFSGCEALESVTLAESGVMLALGGDKGWRFDEDGVLRSGKITHKESSSMSMTVQGEGRLAYRWKASSEYYKTLISDYAYLVVDGAAKGTWESFVLGGAAIGGATDWQEVSIDIENESAHQIDWTFVKNDNDTGTVGEDCVWVDAIAYEPFIKVSFDIAGAEGTIPAFIKDVPGASVTLPSSEGFAKAKHTLTGWSDGVQTYEPGSEYQIGATNVVLAAVYSPNTLAVPVISSDDVASGGEIMSASATVEISAENGTTVYYTLDGTDPTSESLLYGGAFEAEYLGLVTVKAIAVRENCFDSEVAEFSFTRRPYSAAECLNANGMTFTLGGDVEWSRVLDGDAHDGDAAMRSGVITDNQACFIETKVSGAGTISFWWKSSCEVIFNGMKFDYASFAVDGIERDCLAGVSEWTKVSVEIAGSGEHTLRWVYQKDSSDKAGEDCAWLDEVVWTPDPIPELSATATAEQVTAALEGSVDAKLTANITDAVTYAAYRTWALGLAGVTPDAVKASPNAWLSYALNTDKLIIAAPKEGDVVIDTFEIAATEGAYEFTIKIDGITVGENALEANLKRVFDIEGAETLASGGAGFSIDKVEVNTATPESGNVKFSVTPKMEDGEKPNSFFFRVKMR